MPFTVGGIGVGGGGGRTLGPLQNTFGDATTADRAAAEALRDTYATNNATWLGQYNARRTFLILLQWTGDGEVVQRRNSAGNGWEDVTDVIRGPRGGAGPAGPGVPDAGADGDVLAKASAADQDTEWHTPTWQTAAQVTAAIVSYGYQTAAQVTAAIVAYGYQTAAQVTAAIAAALADYSTTAQMNAAIAAAAGGNRFRFGAGVPAAALGDDGDAYLDTDAGTFYSKAAGVWTLRYTEQGGAPPAGMHIRYAAIRTADAMFTAADFEAAEATSSQTNTIDTPDTSDNAFLAFAIPNDVNDLSDIRQEGGTFSYFASFTLSPTLITLDSEDHKVYISNFALNAALIGGNWVLTPSP